MGFGIDPVNQSRDSRIGQVAAKVAFRQRVLSTCPMDGAFLNSSWAEQLFRCRLQKGATCLNYLP